MVRMWLRKSGHIPDKTPTFVLEDAACAAHGGELDYIAVIDGNNFSLEA